MHLCMKQTRLIVKQAKKEDTVIFWGDETGINNQAYHIKGFAPKGQIPAVSYEA